MMTTQRTQDGTHQHVRIPFERDMLQGRLMMPVHATGIIVFAQVSGSARLSARNDWAVEQFTNAGLAVLLIDLLTIEEEEDADTTRQLRYEIQLLARRLTAAVDWLHAQRTTRHLRVGLFGAGTGASAAFVCAADRPTVVGAIVTRSGRADLAGNYLKSVQAPTLMIVGAQDLIVIDISQQALTHLRSQKWLEIVPNASHLFEEPNTLELASEHAVGWFERHLAL